jgi:RNA polymerase sigma factor (sigma-70 family)
MTEKRRQKSFKLLHRLNSADGGAAWSEFVELYTPLLMKAVRQFEFQQDRPGDCFLYVCEKLSDDGFRRLLRFNASGKASFNTWLNTVVFNLCVDWHRKEFGRAQMLPAISALPAFDQSVFRLNFEEGLAFETCLETLIADYPDLTRQQLSDAIARVHSSLTPRQRWQISLRNKRRKTGATSSHAELAGLTAAQPSPIRALQEERETASLNAAMSKLDVDQKLILHMRFQQGLTLKMIAKILHLNDPYQARRLVQSAVKALSRQISRLENAGSPGSIDRS